MISAFELEALLAGLQGVAGVVLHDLETGQEAVHNPNEVFVAASLIKLPVLYHFFLECTAGRLDPDEPYRLSAEAMVPGFGVLRSLQPGAVLRLRDLASLMIVISDNTATNALIDRLGIGPINTTIQVLGLQQTSLQRKLYDHSDPNKNNFTSPRDMCTFYQWIAVNRQLAPLYYAEMLQSLFGQQCRNKLPSGLPREARLAHKTGDMTQIEHDAGLFDGPNRRLIAVVMTKELARNVDGVALCRHVGELAYAYVTQ
jgi:beta-lactamase class A